MNLLAILLFSAYILLTFSIHFVIYKNIKSTILAAILITLVTLLVMLSYSLTIGFERLEKIVYEQFNNISFSEYIPLSTDDDLILDRDDTAPNSIITYQQSSNELLLDDDDLKQTAKDNVQKRIEKQAALQAQDDDDEEVNATDEYGIDRFTEVLLTTDVINDVKQDISLVDKIISTTEQLTELGESEDDINKQITQIKNDYFANIDDDIREQKITDIDELVTNIKNKKSELQQQNTDNDEIDKQIEQLKVDYVQKKIQILKDDKLAELETEEEESLQNERYYLAQKIISDKLEQDEYKNPYNILPLDLWYQPQKTAKDVLSNEPCMCPGELRLDAKMNYVDI